MFNGGGLHEGLAINQGPGVSGDIDNQITVRFNVTAAPPQCLLRTVFPFYEKTQSLIDAQSKELDDKKRQGILSDLQKEMAVQMPAVPWPGMPCCPMSGRGALRPCTKPNIRDGALRPSRSCAPG